MKNMTCKFFSFKKYSDVLDQVNEACGRALIWAGVIRVTFCRPSTECDRRRVGSRKAGGGWARI